MACISVQSARKSTFVTDHETWHQKIVFIQEARKQVCVLSISKPTCPHHREIKIPLVSSKK